MTEIRVCEKEVALEKQLLEVLKRRYEPRIDPSGLTELEYMVEYRKLIDNKLIDAMMFSQLIYDLANQITINRKEFLGQVVQPKDLFSYDKE